MLLKAKDLTKEYHRGKDNFYAVEKVSFTMNRGEFICITGRSGSGKSTLLNMLAGLTKPTVGKIILSGNDYSNLNDRELTNLRNCRIGCIPQGNSILANFSVLDNVRLPFFLYKREGEATLRAKSLLKEMGISHLIHASPSQLSGGELRRVSIARALINHPELLIADEPTVDLDHQTTTEIMQLFSDIVRKGTAILMVTHETELKQYANRRFVMDTGKLTEI